MNCEHDVEEKSFCNVPSVRLRFFEPIRDDQPKKFKRIDIAESMHHATGDEIAWRATHSGKLNIYIYKTPALPPIFQVKFARWT